MAKLAVIFDARAIATWLSTFSNVHVLALIYGNLGITGERCCFLTVARIQPVVSLESIIVTPR